VTGRGQAARLKVAIAVQRVGKHDPKVAAEVHESLSSRVKSHLVARPHCHLCPIGHKRFVATAGRFGERRANHNALKELLVRDLHLL
jgi:hypothetical protein